MPLHVDVDGCIERLQTGECVTQNDLKKLCWLVTDLLLEENTVQPVNGPVTIVGDLHGQFFDLLNLLTVGGWPPDTSYIFLGDFVDRGHNSVETLTLLLCLKLKHPGHITLLRGNHECRQITQVYGFYDECMRKYGNASAWKYCVQCFDFFGLAAIVDGSVFCVHGGLSPDVRTLDQIRAIDRNQEIPHEGAFCDLMWSDPEDIAGAWQVSPRGAGYLFGETVTTEFNSINGLELIARAHQLVMEGRKYHFNKSLVTVWSAPNYCYRCGNVAAILEIGTKSSLGSYGTGSTEEASDNTNNNTNTNTAATRVFEEKGQQQDSESSEEEGEQQHHPVAHEGNEGSITQRFKFFEETELSTYGPKGEERSQLVPYFL